MPRFRFTTYLEHRWCMRTTARTRKHDFCGLFCELIIAQTAYDPRIRCGVIQAHPILPAPHSSLICQGESSIGRWEQPKRSVRVPYYSLDAATRHSQPQHTKGHSDERPDQTDATSRTDPDRFAVGQQDPQPPADAALMQHSGGSRRGTPARETLFRGRQLRAPSRIAICNQTASACLPSMVRDSKARPMQAQTQQLFAYPPAHRDDTLTDYHGTPVADPYRWLEDLGARWAGG